MTRILRPALLRTTLVVTSLAATWGFGELVAWMASMSGSDAAVISEEGLYAVESDPTLGYRLLASHIHTSTKMKADGNTCYSATYRTDVFGRRDVGIHRRPDGPHLLLFGCSVTMGEGLNDADTLQYALAAELPDVNVFNYAVHGWGPTHALAKLRSGAIPAEVRSHDGSAVYVLIPAHVSRTIGDTRTHWLFDSPYYDLLPDGTVAGGAPLRAMRPWRTALQEALVFARSHSWLLTALHPEIPRRHGDEDYERTAAVLAAARESYRSQFRGELFVAFHPTWDLSVAGNREARDRLRALLEQRSVPVLDHAREGLVPADVIDRDCDWHPSGALNHEFARELAVDLSEPSLAFRK